MGSILWKLTLISTGGRQISNPFPCLSIWSLILFLFSHTLHNQYISIGVNNTVRYDTGGNTC